MVILDRLRYLPVSSFFGLVCLDSGQIKGVLDVPVKVCRPSGDLGRVPLLHSQQQTFVLSQQQTPVLPRQKTLVLSQQKTSLLLQEQSCFLSQHIMLMLRWIDP